MNFKQKLILDAIDKINKTLPGESESESKSESWSEEDRTIESLEKENKSLHDLINALVTSQQKK